MGVRAGEIERAAARAHADAAAWEGVAGRVDALRVHRESPCRRVTVTVDGRGRLVDLGFTERFRSADPRDLAAVVVDTLRRAQAALADRVADVVHRAGVVHREAPGALGTLDAVVEGYRTRFPPPEDPRPPLEDSPEFRWLRR